MWWTNLASPTQIPAVGGFLILGNEYKKSLLQNYSFCLSIVLSISLTSFKLVQHSRCPLLTQDNSQMTFSKRAAWATPDWQLSWLASLNNSGVICWIPCFLFPSPWLVSSPFFLPSTFGRDFSKARLPHFQIHPWLPHLWLGPPQSAPVLVPELLGVQHVFFFSAWWLAYCWHKYLASVM